MRLHYLKTRDVASASDHEGADRGYRRGGYRFGKCCIDWREFQGKPPAEPEEEPETQTESTSETEDNVVESVPVTEAESVPETEAAEVVESVPEPEEPVTDESFEDVVVEDL